MNDLSTKNKLMETGKEEFLKKGFKDASLREIVKKSGYTLGAFYGYFTGKEQFFEEIVSGPADNLYNKFLETQTNFASLPLEEKVDIMGQTSADGMNKMVELIYADFDVFKLVFFRSAGTKYERYLQSLIDLEVEYTLRFIKHLKATSLNPKIDEELVHIFASSLFQGVIEIIDHDMSKDNAIIYVNALRRFYSAGWQEVLRY